MGRPAATEFLGKGGGGGGGFSAKCGISKIKEGRGIVLHFSSVCGGGRWKKRKGKETGYLLQLLLIPHLLFSSSGQLEIHEMNVLPDIKKSSPFKFE